MCVDHPAASFCSVCPYCGCANKPPATADAIYWIVIGGLNYQGYVRGNADIYNPATQSRTTEDDTPVASGGFYDCQILRDDKPVATVVNTFFLFGFTAKGAVPAFVRASTCTST